MRLVSNKASLMQAQNKVMTIHSLRRHGYFSMLVAEMGNIYWYWIILRNIDNSIVNSIGIAIEKVCSVILILLLNIVRPNSKYWNWLSLLTYSLSILILNIDYWLAVYQYWYWILTIEWQFINIDIEYWYWISKMSELC